MGKISYCLLSAAVAVSMVPINSATAAPGTATSAGTDRNDQRIHTVTLITGDRVTVAADGVTGMVVQPGEGRQRMTFVSHRAAGHLQVIPSDARALVGAGRLDLRLFDVTTLVQFGFDDRRPDLPLNVTYAAGDAGRAGVQANLVTAGATVVRELPAVDGLAVRESRDHAGEFWNALTTARSGDGAEARDLRGAVSTVWLDGLRRPSLDVSVPQIGAPVAWQAGYTGTGVRVAVLDTGIDTTHPDLAGRVAGEKNFTEGQQGEDARDHVGHGTHVASTVAGSGAASDGRYKGVAPGATLYDGKVCALSGCQESWILAGMQWAAAEQHVKVVNLSLGGLDTPEVDPLERAVQTLTRRYGTLFVVSAGNGGDDESVESPASADDALAVGAVTKTDELAYFSSRGPRIGDSALKPEITAPGVDITAARSTDGELADPVGPGGRYTTLSGTSMAAPHVAGSAAILAQQHPGWSPAQLKAALMAAAKPNPGVGVYSQGAGRVDVGRAVRQTVSTSPASVSFGVQQWPHGDDRPVTRTLTYHNYGTSAVTLHLTPHFGGPNGEPALAGLFTVSATTIRVPAGGDAPVTVRADTRVSGPDGYAGGELTATAGDLVVQTPVAVNKEVESYDLTLTHLDRAGHPTKNFFTILDRIDKPHFYLVFGMAGAVTVRLPKGRYVLTSSVFSPDPTHSYDALLVAPVLNVTAAQAVTVDARRGRPISVTVPRPSARSLLADVGYTIRTPRYELGFDLLGDNFDDTYSAQIGASGTVDGFESHVASQWGQVQSDGNATNSPYAYQLAWFQRGGMITGLRRAVADRDLATVRTDIAAEAAGAQTGKSASARPPDAGDSVWAVVFPVDLPFTRTEYYSTEGGVQWRSELGQQLSAGRDSQPISLTYSPWTVYRAARTYHETWNQGVFGPTFPPRDYPQLWVTRTGDRMVVAAPLYGDGAGRAGYSRTDTAFLTVFRGGVKVGEAAAPVGQFTVPAAAGEYRVDVRTTRSMPFTLSTRTNVVWTFRSGHLTGDQPLALPLSAIRFTPTLDLRNSAPAGRAFTIPIHVQAQPGSAAGPVKTLTADVSFDNGATWRKAALQPRPDGGVTLIRHPAGHGFVSVRAAATDADGNTVEVTIIQAYRYDEQK